MPDDRKYETRCPSCQRKVSIPLDYSGKVRCPDCLFTWRPENNNTTFYVQKPQRKFAMTLGDTIEYGFSMVPAVMMTILISGIVAWGGLEVVAMSPDAYEPKVALCLGVLLLVLSSIIFTSLTFGIGVRVVAEGILIGNIATDDYRNTDGNLTIPNPIINEDNEQLEAASEEPIGETKTDGSEIQSES